MLSRSKSLAVSLKSTSALALTPLWVSGLVLAHTIGLTGMLYLFMSPKLSEMATRSPAKDYSSGPQFLLPVLCQKHGSCFLQSKQRSASSSGLCTLGKLITP